MLAKHFIFSSLSGRLPLYIAYAVSACLSAWFLALGAWHLTREPQTPPQPKYAADRLPSSRVRSVSADAILRRNLMGLTLPISKAHTDTAQSEVETSATDSIPLSKLGWQLLGTVASSVPAESHAALQVDGKHRLAREGEEVNGWLVERILRKNVVVRKGTVRERLVLDVQTLPPVAALHSATTGTTATTSPRGVVSSPPKRASVVLNPAALLREVALRPKSLGTRQGMEITALLSESPLYAHGLRNGDVVLSFNDRPTRSYDDLPALLEALLEDRIRVEVNRLGKEIILE